MKKGRPEWREAQQSFLVCIHDSDSTFKTGRRRHRVGEEEESRKTENRQTNDQTNPEGQAGEGDTDAGTDKRINRQPDGVRRKYTKRKEAASSWRVKVTEREKDRQTD